MRILADENMPGLDGFARHGELRRMPGNAIRRSHLAGVDTLLVRSVTPTGPDLLEGTPVGFVGSATIGTDHVDTAWLARQGIRFAAAPGCNAMAVAEYVLQGVLRWLLQQRREPAECSLAVVGLGNVGTRVVALLGALGMKVVACDPPLVRRSTRTAVALVPLEQALDVDVVSLHVPLTPGGADATRHLLGEEQLARLGADQLLINTSRGAVIDNRALQRRLAGGHGPSVVLDVWEDEPDVPAELFARIWLGTPHIAGYSREGKLRGTQMLYREWCLWRGLEAPSVEIQAPCKQVKRGPVHWTELPALLEQRYRLVDDHCRLRDALAEADSAAAFSRLRQEYPVRHEMAGISLADAPPASLRPLLAGLGVSWPAKDSASFAPDDGRPAVSWPR